MLVASLNKATWLMNRIYCRSMAKSDTLEKLVPHVNSLENVYQDLKAAREEAAAREAVLRAEIAKFRDENLELRGSIGTNLFEINILKTQLEEAETVKAKLESDKEKALEEVEANKVKSQAQFNVFVERVRRAESVRDDIANAAAPILSALYKQGLGTSSLDAVEVFDKLRTAPAKYMENICDAAVMGASFALAQTKSLYPRIDVDSVRDGFAAGTSDERALELISEAQESAKKVAGDVASHFQE